MSTAKNPTPTGFYAYTDTLKGVYYGPKCVETALPKLLDALGAKRALIITGKSLRDKTDVVTRIENILKKSNAYGATFSEIGEHAPEAGIENGISKLREVNADIVVSVGGGSPIDASKAIILRLQEQRIQETPGKEPEFLRQIAIPTTLSAAEYTSGAGYTNKQGDKVVVSHQQLAPAGIILDAELTVATPEQLWLSTGMRALDHAVESLYRPGVPLPLKKLCHAAITDLFRFLVLSKRDSKDLVARQRLQVAAWMSLWPLKLEKHSAVGLSHSLGHKLGATYGIPHGITSCLTLAPVVNLQVELASQEDKEYLAEALFYLREASTGTIDGDVRKLSSMINSLVQELGLQKTLRQYGVPKGDIENIAVRTVGGEDEQLLSKVKTLLESIY
ncbi:alcohol dehydrogenase IV [Rhizopogon vinicolor AM-OR11-026]|uniref:Alcohol dehydrogenase IV n=1 Tax=Rhizopogon vinicolor AM-OR11-026 TaxID=1314800 RepID=A0A1B7N407_9AGAM|nr:alcohol dehydrogenase IV [Rhizopogon vinicolor AM-OR11-026]